MVLASLTSLQARLVSKKVESSEVDPHFNSYVDILNKTLRLANTVANGELPEDETAISDIQFSPESLIKMKRNAELAYLEMQSSLKTKKQEVKNMQQVNDVVASKADEQIKAMLPIVNETKNDVQEKIRRVRAMQSSINSLNREVLSLFQSRSSIIAQLEEWKQILGDDLAAELVDIRKLVKAGKDHNGIMRYKVYGNFSKGEQELLKIQAHLQKEIDKISVEVDSYKAKWLKDVEIFDEMTDVLEKAMVTRKLDAKNDSKNNSSDDEMIDDNEEDEDVCLTNYLDEGELRNNNESEEQVNEEYSLSSRNGSVRENDNDTEAEDGRRDNNDEEQYEQKLSEADEKDSVDLDVDMDEEEPKNEDDQAKEKSLKSDDIESQENHNEKFSVSSPLSEIMTSDTTNDNELGGIDYSMGGDDSNNDDASELDIKLDQ